MLPDLSVFWVIFFVLVLTGVLNQLLLKPLQRVMGTREEAIRSARELAERSAAEARAATAEFDQKTSIARAEIYRQMDEMRKLALNERAGILAATRAEAEAEVARAGATLKADAERGAPAAGGRRGSARRRRGRSDSRPQGVLTLAASDRKPAHAIRQFHPGRVRSTPASLGAALAVARAAGPALLGRRRRPARWPPPRRPRTRRRSTLRPPRASRPKPSMSRGRCRRSRAWSTSRSSPACCSIFSGRRLPTTSRHGARRFARTW